MISKTQQIFNYMREHDGITQLDAYELCTATRLGAVIADFKKHGHKIETIYHPMQHGGRYAEYSLNKNYKKYLNAKEDNKELTYEEWEKENDLL